MNDRDIDIIVALTEDQLHGKAKEDALAHIAAHPELAAELAIQMSAIEHLQSVPAATMTPQERSNLRASLIEQLNLEPGREKAAAPVRRRSWWAPVFGLASAAALVLAIVVVPGMFTSSNDASDVEALSVQAEDATPADESAPKSTTTAAASAAATEAQVLTVPEVAEGEVAEFYADSSEINEDGAATEDVTTAPDEVAEQGGSDGAGGDTSSDTAAASLLTPTAAIETSVLDGCLNDLTDQLPEDLAEDELSIHAATTTDEGLVAHLGVTTETGIAYSISIDLATCTITPIDP